MRRFNFVMIIMLGLVASGHAAAGIDAAADNDTVMKIKYTGGNPSSTTHPAVTVEGKILGLSVNANNSSNARAIIGRVGTSALPNPGASTVGVMGAGAYGVMGKGGTTGIHGEGSSQGVHGIGYGTGVIGSAYYTGVEGSGTYSGVVGEASEGTGVAGYSDGEYGYGVYGYADISNGHAGYFDGVVYAADGFYDGSDKMLKENVRPLDRGLATIMQLEPKSYEMKNGVTRAKYMPGTKFGLIAQDVQTLIPEIVRNAKSAPERGVDGQPVEGGGNRVEFKTINYTALIPVLIKAMHEQQAQIDLLKQEVQRLKGE